MLVEHFRELRRLDEAKTKGAGFLREVEASERLASALERTLRGLETAPTTGARERAQAALLGVGKGCSSCHARFRDNRGE